MRISISDDFDLQKIAQSGQCFRVREFSGGTYRFITESHVLYMRRAGPLEFEISCPPEIWDRVWRPYFDLSRNYSDIRRAVPESDPYMLRAAREGRGIRILRQSPWETLITFIISQRKSIPAIKDAVEQLAVLYGSPIVTPYEELHAFPGPSQLAPAGGPSLDVCKLGYRTSYVMDAVLRVRSGALALPSLAQCSDGELVGRLKQVRGVGDKVANCVALFAYGRTGLVPIDTWISRVIAREYRGENPFPSYGGGAGIFQQYAFYSARLHEGRL